MHASVNYVVATNISTVTFSDGIQGNDIAIRLSGDYTDQGWKFVSDGHGTIPGTLVQLAPPRCSQTLSTSAAIYMRSWKQDGPGFEWMFQAAVTDSDANVITQGHHKI